MADHAVSSGRQVSATLNLRTGENQRTISGTVIDPRTAIVMPSYANGDEHNDHQY
jgi:hypothetical protein